MSQKRDRIIAPSLLVDARELLDAARINLPFDLAQIVAGLSYGLSVVIAAARCRSHSRDGARGFSSPLSAGYTPAVQRAGAEEILKVVESLLQGGRLVQIKRPAKSFSSYRSSRTSISEKSTARRNPRPSAKSAVNKKEES